MRKSIKNIRGNVSEKLWEITKDFDVLIRENWTERALSELKVHTIFASPLPSPAKFRFSAKCKVGRSRVRELARTLNKLTYDTAAIPEPDSRIMHNAGIRGQPYEEDGEGRLGRQRG